MRTRNSWIGDADGSTCVGEALDPRGKVVGRVRISVTHETAADAAAWNGAARARLKKLMEQQAEAMARELAELSP